MNNTVKIIRLLVIGSLVTWALAGCSNPYVHPDVSTAVSAQKQAKALERIADALERAYPAEAIHTPEMAKDSQGQQINAGGLSPVVNLSKELEDSGAVSIRENAGKIPD
jgi:endonuclease IV